MPRRISVRRYAEVQTMSVANSNNERISCEPRVRVSAAVASFLDGTANTALIARLWPACSGSGRDAVNGGGRGTTSIRGSSERTATRTRHAACATNTCADIEQGIAWEPPESSPVDRSWMKHCRQDDRASTNERTALRLSGCIW